MCGLTRARSPLGQPLGNRIVLSDHLGVVVFYLRFLMTGMYIRGGQRPMGNSKSQKCDGCPIDSHFIGLGLLRTVFEIYVAGREGPAPALCCIAGDIAGGIPKNCF